jgi:hypothetical protein
VFDQVVAPSITGQAPVAGDVAGFAVPPSRAAVSDCPDNLGVFCTQMLSIAPTTHTAAGIMPGGRGCPTYWWGSPG